MFIDEGKLPIPVSHNGLRTRSEIENYVNNLKKCMMLIIMKLYQIKTLLIYHLHLKMI